MQMMKATQLIFDETLYPREAVSENHINQLADALRAGAQFPPVSVWSNGNRILDGIHRWRAYRKVFGNEAEIPVELRELASDQEAFLFAIEANATHGLRFMSFERTKILLRATELGISNERVAVVLSVPVATLVKVETRMGIDNSSGKPLRVAVKPPLASLRGKELTAAQLEANKTAGGMPAEYYVGQVISLVNAGLCDWGSKSAKRLLLDLQKLLARKLKKQAG